MGRRSSQRGKAATKQAFYPQISQESAAAGEELSHQAHKLNDLVQELANIVGRDRRALPPQKQGRDAVPCRPVGEEQQQHYEKHFIKIAAKSLVKWSVRNVVAGFIPA